MKPLLRWLSLVAVALVALQLFFVARIATMAVVAPQSSSFQRSEAWRLASERMACTGASNGSRIARYQTTSNAP